MTREIIFHIGDHKTGSTSIQSALAAKHIVPEGKVLLYPSQLNHNHLVELRRKGKAIKGKQFSGPNIRPKKFSELAHEINNSDYDICIISAEAFESFSPSRLYDVIAKYFDTTQIKIRVIAYVRPHAARILSSYAEKIKISPLPGSLDDYHEKTQKHGKFRYYSRFKMWREIFGEQFILRPMVREYLEGDCIVRDFASQVLQDTPFHLKESAKDNESPSLEDLSMFQFIQNAFSDSESNKRIQLGWQLQRVLLQLPARTKSTKLRLHVELARRISDAYKEDAMQMDADFFQGKPILQDALTKSIGQAIPTPQSLDVEQHFDADEMRSIRLMTTMITEMYQAKPRLWPPYFKQLRINDLKSECEAP